MNLIKKLITFLFLGFQGCKFGAIEKSIPVIDIGAAMETVEAYNLSNIADNISYVALETTDSSLIGNYPDIAVWKDKIIISSIHQPLMVFDKNDGHFCNHIGHIGEDPEGCQTDGWGNVPFWVDQTNGTVYLTTSRPSRFLHYDIDGTFLNYVDLALDETGINHWTFYGMLVSNDTLTAHNKYVSSADNTYIVSFYTLTGNVIDTVPSIVPPYPDDREGAFYRYGVHVPYGRAGIWMFDYPDHKIAYIVPGSPSLWTYDGQRYLKEAFIDTVYTVNSNHLTPRIALDLGKFHWSCDRRMDKDSSIGKISIDYILENDNLIYFHFHTGLYENRDNIRTYCGFYDKRTGATKVMDGDRLSTICPA